MQVNYWATPTWNVYYKQICLLMNYSTHITEDSIVDNYPWWSSPHSSITFSLTFLFFFLFYKQKSYIPIFPGVILLKLQSMITVQR